MCVRVVTRITFGATSFKKFQNFLLHLIFRARVADPVSVVLNNGQTLYSIPPPGSGIILGFIMNVMENYKVEPKDYNSPLMYHRLIESFKYGYAYRSQIGDPGDQNITRVVNDVRFFFILYFPSYYSKTSQFASLGTRNFP